MSKILDDFISFPEHERYYWQPKEDITAYELALCLPVFVVTHDIGFDASSVIRNLPDNARRHFVDVTPKQK